MSAPAKHSPAPWRFCIDGEMDEDCNIPKVDAPLNFRARGHCNNPSILDANGETVVGCSEYNVFDSRNQPSNVALMLSAPELLAELERTEASLTAILCSRVIDSTTSTWLELRRDRDAIRSAIARATGGNA